MKQCGIRGGDEGLLCTEPTGHEGPHEARCAEDGPVVDSWESEPQLRADRDALRSFVIEIAQTTTDRGLPTAAAVRANALLPRELQHEGTPAFQLPR